MHGHGHGIRLGDLAHARSGDKGNLANIGVVAEDARCYAWLSQHLTADVVARYFAPMMPTKVERFEAANVLAVNFVLCDILAGNAAMLVEGQDSSFQNKVHLAMDAKGFGDVAQLGRPKKQD